MDPESLIHVFAVQQIDSELQALSDQGGEEEEAEGDDLEDQKLLGDVNSGVAGGTVLETSLARRRKRETNEDGDGEEGVYVDEAIESSDVNARCG